MQRSVIVDLVPVLRRHRDACLMLARVERGHGRMYHAAKLVDRARRVTRDIIHFLKFGD